MDKIAIISDIHGNLEALKAVLKDIEERGLERVFCLGDMISKGTHQQECVNLIKENCDIVLKGNCDEYFTSDIDLSTKSKQEVDRIIWNKSKLTEENVEYFKLGTGNGVTVLELINTFEKATGVKVPHKIVGRREGDIEKVWANPERANKVLGWTAKETLSDTLASAWKWQEKLRERGIQ